MKRNPSVKAACKAISKRTDLADSADMGDLMVLLNNEAKIHQKCHTHENIVTILSSFGDKKFNFIMLELRSQTFSSLLSEQYFVDFDEWLIFMHQILNGVNFIHQKNVIHRDLKLCNILLTERNVVKICDFG